jgi:hypothetical protein
MATLNKLALVFSGATGETSGNVNGIFLYQGIKDDMPFYKNLANQMYCYRASDGKWCVSTNADFEAGKAFGWCYSAEEGLGHPSRASMWLVVNINGKFEDQPSVKVATMVTAVVLRGEREKWGGILLCHCSLIDSCSLLKNNTKS